MRKFMTKLFVKWASKQKIPNDELDKALEEVGNGNYEANLGGHIYKKRIRFPGQGKRGSGRTIVCYKKGSRIIFIHGFSKNEKSNLSPKELFAFKELAKILLSFSEREIDIAVQNGDLKEVAT
jgi:hypothetical protein